MAKQISDIARQLGLSAEAIIEKCVAEGVPRERVKDSTSRISAGLELSIREWFSGGSGGVAGWGARVSPRPDSGQEGSRSVR